jgi:hypothetical protein
MRDMKITLELWDDQSGADEKEFGSTMWQMKLNGHEIFQLMTLKQAHIAANKIMDVEDMIHKGEHE